MIYEIVCNETGDRYIGSTFEPTLARRMAAHRACKDCASKNIIARGNFYCNLLEKINVNTRDELRMHERKWYEKLPNINRRTPYRSKDEQLEYNRLYNNIHKDEIKAKRKERKEILKSAVNI